MKINIVSSSHLENDRPLVKLIGPSLETVMQ